VDVGTSATRNEEEGLGKNRGGNGLAAKPRITWE